MMNMYGIDTKEASVHDIVTRNWKKKVFFGIGLLVSVAVMISIGLYAAHRTGANQLSADVTAPEETDMRINVKVDNGVVEPQDAVNDTRADSTVSNGESSETNPSVQVQVDGTSIDIPEDGTVHKVIQTEDGSTSIDISTQSNSSSGDSRTRSSINIDADTDSSVRIRSQTRE